MTFENSLDPDQARRFVGPDSDSKCLTLLLFSQTIVLKKSAKIKARERTILYFPACEELRISCYREYTRTFA